MGKKECRSFLDASVNYSTIEGTHAMVLIGVRTDTTHNHVFLLQNCGWLGRELIEVSVDYLKKTGATICFVAEKLDMIPADFPSLEALLCESSVDVGGDGACDDRV